jgi:cytoskeletal protein CcmA (bactofilin family)
VAAIGPSISIKGDVVGGEDLLVEGKVEGEIRVKNHSVTVGRSGQVKADVHAKSVVVEGEVFGSLYGQEDVSIRQSGKVQGNIVAPRVTLEDGSTFRGSIDMRSPEQAKPEQGKPEQAKSPQASNAPAAANAKPSAAPSNQAVIPGKSEKSA